MLACRRTIWRQAFCWWSGPCHQRGERQWRTQGESHRPCKVTSFIVTKHHNWLCFMYCIFSVSALDKIILICCTSLTSSYVSLYRNCNDSIVLTVLQPLQVMASSVSSMIQYVFHMAAPFIAKPPLQTLLGITFCCCLPFKKKKKKTCPMFNNINNLFLPTLPNCGALFIYACNKTLMWISIAKLLSSIIMKAIFPHHLFDMTTQRFVE